MIIEDYQTKFNARTTCELESFLLKRHRGSVNEFWISPDDQEFPAMSVLVNGDIACVQYFPYEDHPGYISKAASLPVVAGEAVFYVNTPTEEIEISGYQVVSVGDAQMAAKEFFSSGELPKAILWEEL